jgi:hypothetical protein
VRTARKLATIAALTGLLVSVAAVCPCPPAAAARVDLWARQEHDCCPPGEAPAVTAAARDCCVQRDAIRSVATLAVALSALPADATVALSLIVVESALRSVPVPTRTVSHPALVLRI